MADDKVLTKNDRLIVRDGKIVTINNGCYSCGISPICSSSAPSSLTATMTDLDYKVWGVDSGEPIFLASSVDGTYDIPQGDAPDWTTPGNAIAYYKKIEGATSYDFHYGGNDFYGLPVDLVLYALLFDINSADTQLYLSVSIFDLDNYYYGWYRGTTDSPFYMTRRYYPVIGHFLGCSDYWGKTYNTADYSPLIDAPLLKNPPTKGSTTVSYTC